MTVKDDTPQVDDNQRVAVRANRGSFWLGFTGLMLGFLFFSVLMAAMLAIRYTEGDTADLGARNLLYLAWIFARHGIPLLVWISFRRRILHGRKDVAAILAVSCWLYTLSFIYVLMNPVQW